jgi:hypothetical protein
VEHIKERLDVFNYFDCSISWARRPGLNNQGLFFAKVEISGLLELRKKLWDMVIDALQDIPVLTNGYLILCFLLLLLVHCLRRIEDCS